MPLWFQLVIIYAFKHYIADYIAQSNRYMLGKFRADWGFFLPLISHVSVHAVGTWLITVWLVGWKIALGLAIFDATIHFIMDRLKAGPKYLGRWKSLSAREFPTATPQQIRDNGLFWLSLGFDQLVHGLTHYTIIWYVLKNR